MSFADKLKQARHSRGITQRELAKEIGYNPAVIATIESGSRKPSRNVAIALSKFFETSTDYWLEEDNIDDLYKIIENSSNKLIGAASMTPVCGLAVASSISSILGGITGAAINGITGIFHKENDFVNTRAITKELINREIITKSNINNLDSNIEKLLLNVIKKDLYLQLQNKDIEEDLEQATKTNND